MLTRPPLLLRLDGLAVAIAAVWVFMMTGASAWWWAALLAPDLAMLGYLRGPETGAAAYNAAHTYVAPLLLAGVASAVAWAPGLPLALVWAAHIGMDRALGYGLKLPTGFQDTHLGRIGRTDG